MALLDSKLGELIFNVGNALADACFDMAVMLEDWDTDETVEKTIETVPVVLGIMRDANIGIPKKDGETV